MEGKQKICSWIDESKQQAFDISDYLWEHPELSMQESGIFRNERRSRNADRFCRNIWAGKPGAGF